MDSRGQLDLFGDAPSAAVDRMRIVAASMVTSELRAEQPRAASSLSVVGLFTGIGGIELGLERAGHASTLLCEIDRNATAVLQTRFPDVPLVSDVRDISVLPSVDVVAAGFPCQDLSQAGRTAGIGGRQSGLISEVFRLVREPIRDPTWLVLENVPFMLQLDRGEAMRFLTRSLVELGYSWAYRVIDSRAFGLPQRRQRVILVASRRSDPRGVLFSDDASPNDKAETDATSFGFYWTEGTRGLGWGVDVVPTLKGGSTVGIPSPPAIWLAGEAFVGTPDIRDAERLQGFDVDWTAPAAIGARGLGARWKLVGNAVSVPVAEWLGSRLRDPGPGGAVEEELALDARWPDAAYGDAGGVRRVAVSRWPVTAPLPQLRDFLEFPLKPLSEKATRGFLRRARESRLRFMPGFLEGVERHLVAIGGVS
jgi:DNA (cytosine-5)-methyltransferase 1